MVSGDIDASSLKLVGVFAHKMVDQGRDVFRPLPQRGNKYLDDIEPIIQVFPEFAIANILF